MAKRSDTLRDRSKRASKRIGVRWDYESERAFCLGWLVGREAGLREVRKPKRKGKR